MRILAIGDIHGCTTAFDALLAEVQPRPDDLLITLGDYVDRGPDSRGVIDRLLALQTTHRLVALRGNHDIMMMDARLGTAPRDWLSVGGRQTLASYADGIEGGSLADVPESHWAFLEQTCDWYETETHFFVHANVYPDKDLDEQPSYMLHWEKLYEAPTKHVSGKIMVCGHTSQRAGKPVDYGPAICIDTWVYGDGWLTCLDVENRLYWQANQRGETRMANLDRLSRR